MAWNKPLLKSLLFIFCLINSNFVVAETCESLKNYFKTGLNVENAQPKIARLEALMGNDDLCAKNLLGQLVFEGVYLPKSTGYAKAIFSDLATKDYPPAMFNLAFALSKEKDSDPEQVTTILLGIYAKYLTDRTYNKLAYKAADYGRQYIKSLDEPNKLIIEKKFEDGISSTTLSATNDIHEKVRRSNEILANFGKVILVSAAIYVGAVVGSSIASSGSTTYIQNNVVNYTPNPSLYQIYSPGGGQFYALPLR